MDSGKIYHYDMRFAIDGQAIPDPQKFNGESSQLDTLGERDVTGRVHRNMVASKRHPSMTYENIDWDMIQHIGSLLAGKEFYRFSYPDPFEPSGVTTITAYTADLKWELTWAPSAGSWIGNLKFNVIEQ